MNTLEQLDWLWALSLAQRGCYQHYLYRRWKLSLLKTNGTVGTLTGVLRCDRGWSCVQDCPHRQE
jgi:hypothetical protein